MNFSRVVLILFLIPFTASNADPIPNKTNTMKQFTFSYPFTDGDKMKPRGGTSKGPMPTLVSNASNEWKSLQESGLSDFERDRRAILAMAGPYRTSFDFLEVVRFVEDSPVQKPYQSWGTEYVYVIDDKNDFISLQHIIVMFFVNERGETNGPVVMKHWRQDWQYQDQELLQYAGHNRWKKKSISNDLAQGTWSQAVYQVDDSPRYESFGTWQHKNAYSSWISANTWRPLPRREYSVRDDYHVLEGTNRHTITPTGWVHEQENLKLVLEHDGSPSETQPYLAKELGLNRYERIVDHDFSAGDTYWQKTNGFWKDVRKFWASTIQVNSQIILQKTVNGQSMFMPLFTYAEKTSKADSYQSDQGQAFIHKTLSEYFTNTTESQH